jgi:hypothetical protein
MVGIVVRNSAITLESPLEQYLAIVVRSAFLALILLKIEVRWNVTSYRHIPLVGSSRRRNLEIINLNVFFYFFYMRPVHSI